MTDKRKFKDWDEFMTHIAKEVIKRQYGDKESVPLNPSKYKCEYKYVNNPPWHVWCDGSSSEYYGEIKKESVMEWINGATYEDRRNILYRFIGKLDDLLYFSDVISGVVTTRAADGSYAICGKDSTDIIRHVKPKKSVKGYAYMFEHPHVVYGMTGCLGVIRSEMTSYNADYVNACVPIDVEYTDRDGL